MFYVVLNIWSSELLYAGKDLDFAAAKLSQGTCYGAGTSFEIAMRQAKRRARRFRLAA